MIAATAATWFLPVLHDTCCTGPPYGTAVRIYSSTSLVITQQQYDPNEIERPPMNTYVYTWTNLDNFFEQNTKYQIPYSIQQPGQQCSYDTAAVYAGTSPRHTHGFMNQ